MIKKILIAIDGSSHSTKAAEIGSDIAAKYGAEVVLVHVLLHQELPQDLKHLIDVEYLTSQAVRPAAGSAPVADLGSYFSLGGGGKELTSDVIQAVGEQVLRQAETTARKQGADKISTRIEDGKPVDKILEIANSEGVDLIVSGARGLSDVKAIILGSVSHKLAQLSPVPCLTVH